MLAPIAVLRSACYFISELIKKAFISNSAVNPPYRGDLAAHSSNHMNDLINPIPRRTFIRRAAVLAGSGALASMLPHRVHGGDKITVVNSIRSLSNPYHATWNQGGQAFANAIGADYVTLVTEGDSEKGIADIRAVLAKTGGNMVLNV